jgi:hypothetical protein
MRSAGFLSDRQRKFAWLGFLLAAFQAPLAAKVIDDASWLFAVVVAQLVEEYDDGYWSEFRALEKAARDELAGGRRHLHEAGLKERRRTHGRPGHEAR